MKFRTIVGLIIVLIVCSCAQRASKGELPIEKGQNQQLGAKSGLLLEPGGKRGTEYTDSLGVEYSLRYIPIFLTNDTTIPIHVEISFLKEYNYSVEYGDAKFKLIPFPEEWAQNGVTESMYAKLPGYIDNPSVNETIEPGEKVTLGIGTLVVSPRDVSINLDAPFAHTENGVFSTCDWQMNKDPSSNSQISLGLKLDINELCTIIPCGQISYPEH